MNISLTPRLEKLVQEKVASGLYNSASEVVREALRLLDEIDHVREAQIQNLRKQVMIGMNQINQGKTKVFDEKAVERIKAQGRKRIGSSKNG